MHAAAIQHGRGGKCPFCWDAQALVCFVMWLEIYVAHVEMQAVLGKCARTNAKKGKHGCVAL